MEEDIKLGQLLDNAEYFQMLCGLVAKWGEDRNITLEGGATPLTQAYKLREEAVEVEEAILLGDVGELQRELGDALVVLLNICRLSGLSLTDCLHHTYMKIKDRKGKMIDGVFVKEEDL